MAAHRKSGRRLLAGRRGRTAAALALAGAATATALDGTVHAAPAPSPAQVRARVAKLYQQAEAATDRYNGAKEKAEAAERRLGDLQDQVARRTQHLNDARNALGSAAAARYRTGGLPPAVQLALSSEPDQYLERASLAERAGSRQTEQVAGVQRQLGELKRLRSAARQQAGELAAHRAELRREKQRVTGKLGEARRLLSRLTAAERARATARHTSPGHPTRTAHRPAPTTPVAAPGTRAGAAVAYARSALGKPYVWGATGPHAYDCSGLTLAAYRAAGISLPRTTYAQINAGHRVSKGQLRPGDLVFFYSGISHVGIYIGGGQMIHAPNPSAPVRIAPINQMPFAGATRVG
ncbi:NlpC/P60 family protein [Streptomyces sp. NPDC058045]|uniref:C40 family peptidase n=1 Tax=Streptomyces sp. NPDC058045 TaxID=3346311 RepID=UPI0036E6852F